MFKVNILLISAASFPIEGNLICSVKALVDLPIIFLLFIIALTRDSICMSFLVLAPSQSGEAPGPGELFWTSLTLPFLLLAPGQLSVTAGVAHADCLFEIVSLISIPLALLYTGVWCFASRYVGSWAFVISVIVLKILITCVFTCLRQIEDNTSGAGGWRPLGTIIFDSLEAVLPPEAGAFRAL